MALSNWGDFAPLTAAHWVSVFEQGSVIDLPVLRIKAMFGYPGSDVRMVFFKKTCRLAAQLVTCYAICMAITRRQ